MPKLDWSQFDTVLLDMDGTLLDLHFDNHFWLEHMPRRYAELHNKPISDAHKILQKAIEELRGSLEWYCMDHWEELTGLDLVALHYEVAERIQPLPYAMEFLQGLNELDKKVFLATNAHRKSIQVKFDKVPLDNMLDGVHSSHDYRAPKEDVAFWPSLQQALNFVPERTLFVDDNEEVAAAAQEFGIGQVLVPRQPDSQKPARDIENFRSFSSFSEILPGHG